MIECVRITSGSAKRMHAMRQTKDGMKIPKNASIARKIAIYAMPQAPANNAKRGISNIGSMLRKIKTLSKRAYVSTLALQACSMITKIGDARNATLNAGCAREALPYLALIKVNMVCVMKKEISIALLFAPRDNSLQIDGVIIALLIAKNAMMKILAQYAQVVTSCPRTVNVGQEGYALQMVLILIRLLILAKYAVARA
jgi:hypothetical protein